MNILFKYPTRNRPSIFKDTLEKYYNLMSKKHNFQFIITADTNDNTMNNDNMREYLISKPNLIYSYGNSQSKIQAVNADMVGREFDILVLVSDDMIPVVEGYDDIIVENMVKHFPDMDGALHFNDGRVGKNDAITLSIMGKKMYDYFGYIYHPAYRSLFCDNEFRDCVYSMKKCVWIDQVVIKHYWQDLVGNDEIQKLNSKHWTLDQSTYNRRKAAGFPKINSKEGVVKIINNPSRNPYRRFN